MTVPDPLVYACLPVLGGAGVWIGQQFVQSVISRNSRNKKEIAEIDNNTRHDSHQQMTVRDYREVSELLKQDLNGRYMFATEAREKFSSLERKIDQLGREMKALLAEGPHAHDGRASTIPWPAPSDSMTP